MPNKIPLAKVEAQLPSFVKIIPETYRGVRYNAKFIDTEYNNEEFTAFPKSVISLQHGCKTRSNEKRGATISKKFKGTHPRNRITPIELVKEALPPFLEINEETYRGVREKAEFYDKEYDVTFTSVVANMVRGKGYCAERKKIEFSKAVSTPVEEIESRVNELYEGRIKIVRESYTKGASVCKWIIDGTKEIIGSPNVMLAGKYFLRKELERWKFKVLVRDNFRCLNCESDDNLCAHHIEPWSKNKELRLDSTNGATLCENCHNLYHSKYYRIENSENFEEFLKTP